MTLPPRHAPRNQPPATPAEALELMRADVRDLFAKVRHTLRRIDDQELGELVRLHVSRAPCEHAPLDDEPDAPATLLDLRRRMMLVLLFQEASRRFAWEMPAPTSVSGASAHADQGVHARPDGA